ncbi:MAG: glycosyltransferase family 2 protein [Clostridiales bacterium]|jgi:glycosyltransferase involved in cell wall biosynthesis|nr:glycosyltransferase family 2 protein [Clostridiales bacterium]
MNTVSIIVPIYNAQKYIDVCLDSILKQTYQDFELILVDDGSQDASGRICDLYEKKDERITVYHRDNHGVSASRNFGLAHARGKYVLFIDADDSIEPNMLKGCIELADENKADLVICSFRYYMRDDNNRMVENSLASDFCGSAREVFDQWFITLVEKEILNPPWNKLIKKELLDKRLIQFHEEFSICEDMTFSTLLLSASKTTVLTGNMYYNYFISKSGTLVFKFHDNYFEAVTHFYDTAYSYCKKFRRNSKQMKIIDTLYVNLTIMFIKQICTKSPWDKRSRYKKIIEIGKKEKFLKAVKSANLTRKRKLVCYLLKNRKVNMIFMLFKIKDWKDRIIKSYCIGGGDIRER